MSNSATKIGLKILFIILFPIWLPIYVLLQIFIYPLSVTASTYQSQGLKFPICLATIPGLPCFYISVVVYTVITLPCTIFLGLKNLIGSYDMNDALKSFFWPKPHPYLQRFLYDEDDAIVIVDQEQIPDRHRTVTNSSRQLAKQIAYVQFTKSDSSDDRNNGIPMLNESLAANPYYNRNSFSSEVFRETPKFIGVGGGDSFRLSASFRKPLLSDHKDRKDSSIYVNAINEADEDTHM